MRGILKRTFASLDLSTLKLPQTKLLINNQWVNSISGETLSTTDPFHEREITKIQKGGKSDIDKAVKAAKTALEEGPWRNFDGEQRAKLLYKMAQLVEKHGEELSILESLETGNTLIQSQLMTIHSTAALFRYYAGWANKIAGQTIPITGPYFCFTRREPVGVCGLIYPWNFPIMLGVTKLAAALATGCTVVMKPPEQASLASLRLAELILEADFPPGVINMVTGSGDEAGGALVQHPNVDLISFTGSTEVGRQILSSSGRPNIKRLHLELGGKSANIILADADMDLAIKQAHHALFFSQGQCCIAGTRTFVHESLYDEFLEKSIALAKTKVLGDPFDPTTTQGPQVSKVQQERVLKYINKGKEEGARVAFGGDKYQGSGYFVNPTIFADVCDEMVIAKEEIFGPVMSILRFSDVDEVIKRANSSNYGLGAGIVGKSTSEIFKLTKSLRVGMIFVNCYDEMRINTPFGGYKDSGFGRQLGEAGLESYLENKTVIMQE